MTRIRKLASPGALIAVLLCLPALAQAQYTGVGTSGGNWDTTRPGGPGYQQAIDNYQGGSPGIPASYDLKVGDVYLRAGGGVDFTFNDNVSLRPDDEDPDFIISPNARLGYYFPFTRENGMQFSLDFGAQFYMNHDEFNNFTIFNYVYPVNINDCGESVSNNDCCSSSTCTIQSLLHYCFT